MDKLAKEQETIQGKFEALQFNMYEDQEETKSKLGKYLPTNHYQSSTML